MHESWRWFGPNDPVSLDDIGKGVNPGYSAIGRLKGLAEIRGAICQPFELRKNHG